MIEFSEPFLVRDGRPKSSITEVWQDASSTIAPLYPNENVEVLVTLKADLRQLKRSELSETVMRLGDGKQYYVISGAVEATFTSGNTKYTLLYRGMYKSLPIDLKS